MPSLMPPGGCRSRSASIQSRRASAVDLSEVRAVTTAAQLLDKTVNVVALVADEALRPHTLASASAALYLASIAERICRSTHRCGSHERMPRVAELSFLAG